MELNISYKSINTGAIKDVDMKSQIVTGYFSTFNVIDSDGDMILPGAFAKTINENGPKDGNVQNSEIYHLWQHRNEMLGKPRVLKEDERGLYFETWFDTQIDLAKDILRRYETGLLNQHSIGFSTIRSNNINDEDGNTKYTELVELKLWEGSTVLWGANKDTPFLGIKGMDKPTLIKELKERYALFCKEIKNGKYTDQTFTLLKIEALKIEDMIKSLNIEAPSVQDTPDIEPINISKVIESFKNNIN